MKLQRLSYLCAVAQENFSISRAAAAVGATQPAVSKQIRLLELEIGADLLIRRGNRIVGLTAIGEAIIDAARRTVWEAQNLQRITQELTHTGGGRLVIATTHMYARYVLRPVIKKFMRSHPHVQLVLRQGIPANIAEWIMAGEADMGIAGKSLDIYDDLVLLDGKALHRSLIVPRRHPLLRTKRLTLKAIAEYPMIVLDAGLEGGSTILNAFRNAGIAPNVVLSALDADVVKSYVELGLGIAVLLTIAYERERDRDLRAIKVEHLFQPTIFHIVLRPGKYLPAYMYDFIEILAAKWDRSAINSAMRTKVGKAKL